MITIAVHTQKLMCNRIDYVCPVCAHKSCYYPAMGSPVHCEDCKAMLPDTRELHNNKVFRLNWHFYQPIGATG